MKTILVTGTLGFIFTNFIRLMVPRYQDRYRFVGVDKAVHEHNMANRYAPVGYRMHYADIADGHVIDRIFAVERPDYVIGGAAESFVDDAIADVLPFLHTNVLGTQTLINACLRHGVERYMHISTDEVYGQQVAAQAPAWTEECPMMPRNPYAASKACAELVVRSAHETHGLQYQITRSCNVYGPRQKRANLVPRIIDASLTGTSMPIHGDGYNWRQYIHVEDVSRAFMTILEKGSVNAIYNIGDETLVSNLQMVGLVGGLAGREPAVEFIADRKAHDRGYRVDSSKLRTLGWRPIVPFADGLRETIEYYRWRLQCSSSSSAPADGAATSSAA